jgi:uncharacterized membrane protein YphA (DoxX/SURF4 family)
VVDAGCSAQCEEGPVNVALWILQIGLGLAFAVLGYTHAFRFEPFAANPRTRWARNVGASNLRIIGILEILGGVGLILPAATGILPWLTPLAAAMLALVMVLAILFHARRPGEAPNIVVNAVLGILALAVAYGRFVIEPL